MSEKQAKKKRREQIFAKYEITVFANNEIEISGPIDNFPLYRDVMNRVERIVLDRLRENLQNRSNILVPKLNTSKLKLH